MRHQIRRATIRDASILAALCGTVQRIHVEAHPQHYKPFTDDSRQLVKWFRRRLRDKGVLGYIAENSDLGVPIGYLFACLVRIKESPFGYAGTNLYIEQMSVEEEWQRSGVGSALMAEFLRAAKRIGVQTISLDVAAFNETALEFYKRHQFEFRFHSMERKFD